MAALTIDQILQKLSKDAETAPILQTSSQSFIRENIHLFAERSETVVNPTGWQTFICLKDKEPTAIPSKLRTGLNSFRSFLQMTPYQVSSLVPKLKFYKVYTKNDGTYDRQEPINFPDSSLENINSILSSKDHRNDDIALRSFGFDFSNQNPYAAGRAVDCRLSITMANGESLLKERTARKKQNTPGFRFSDLLVRQGTLNHKNFDGEHYEIRVDIGYNYPKNLSQGLKKDIDNLSYSMILTMLDYDITFQQNGVLDLEISYRGRVEYVTRHPRKYNIFKDGGDTDTQQLEAQLQHVKSQLERKGDVPRETNPETAASELDLELLDEVDALQKDVTFYENQLEELKTRNRISKYSQLLTRMKDYGKLFKVSFKKEELLLYGDAFQKAVDVEVGRQLDSNSPDVIGTQALLNDASSRRGSLQKSIEDQINNTTSLGGFQEVNINKLVQIEAEKKAKERNVDLAVGNPAEVDQIYTDANNDVTNDLLTGKVPFIKKPKALDGVALSHPSQKNKKHIYWFYYGDLIDNALKISKTYEDMEKDKVACILSSFNLTTYTRQKDSIVETKRLMNIADVPITVEDFNNFWNKQVVDKERDNYTVFAFINDTIQQLLMPALNVLVFGVPSRDAKIFKTIPMEFPCHGSEKTEEFFTYDLSKSHSKKHSLYKPPKIKESSERLFGTAGATLGIGEIATQEHIPKLSRVSLDKDSALRQRLKSYRSRIVKCNRDQRWSYYLFYETNLNESLSWDGNKEFDEKRGVSHFFMGSASGVLKSVNFSKTERPGLPEMMAERALRSGDLTAQLWRNFEASMSLEGNALFFPGMYLYLDPSTAGFGSIKSSKSLSRVLGLGGYYMVLSVRNQIDGTGWTTNIHAIWQSAPPLKS